MTFFVGVDLVTVLNTPIPPDPSVATQWAYFESSGHLYRSQYNEATWLSDDGDLILPTGVGLLTAGRSPFAILSDSSGKVAPGSLLLDGSGSTAFSVFDFFNEIVYSYPTPAGKLVSPPVFGGGFIIWVEVDDTSSGDSTHFFTVTVKQATTDLMTIIDLGATNILPGIANTPIRPRSPRLTDNRIYILLGYNTAGPVLHLLDYGVTLAGSFTPHTVGSQNSYVGTNGNALGYPGTSPSTFYTTREADPAHSYLWQQDNPTDAPVDLWPAAGALPGWAPAGGTDPVRFGHLAFSSGLFQVTFADTPHTVMRDSIEGSAEDTPLAKFVPDSHPTLMILPEIMVYIGDSADITPPVEGSPSDYFVDDVGDHDV